MKAAKSAIFVGEMLPPLKMPICENVSKCAGAMARVCMPPIERPARARWG